MKIELLKNFFDKICKGSKKIDLCQIKLEKMNNNEEISEFAISIKGDFPESFRDHLLDRNFSDLKVGFGSIKFKGTQSQLDDFLSECQKRESEFKVIGVHDLSETLVEIGTRKNLKGEIIEIFVFEVHKPSQRFVINFEEANFLVQMNDRTRFQSKFPDSFRAFVKINQFNQIVKSNQE